MYYADWRQQYLVDQGYYFDVIEELPFMKDEALKKTLLMHSETEQVDLLGKILSLDEAKLEDGEESEEDEDQK